MLALSYVARVTNICRIRRILITSLLLILFSFAFDVKSLNQNKHAPKKTKKTFIHTCTTTAVPNILNTEYVTPLKPPKSPNEEW